MSSRGFGKGTCPHLGRWAVSAVVCVAACSDDRDRAPAQAARPAAEDANDAPGGAGESPGDVPDDPGGAADPDPGPATAVHVEALIDHEALPLLDGQSAPTTFTVPADAVSMAVVVEGAEEGEYTVSDWRDDTGFVLVRPRWWTTEDFACRTCPNTVSWQAGTFTAIAPDNPQSRLNPGRHTLTVEGSGPTEQVRLTVWVKRAPAPPTSGVVDLHLYFTGAYDWTAAAAPASRYFDDVMRRVDEVLGHGGLGVGTISFEDLDPSFANVDHTYGPGNDLSELLKQSAGRDSTALNIFFVDELYAGSSTEARADDPIIGLSPAPGPPLTHGTIHSGVVVSTWSTLSIPEGERWPNALAHTIAHETAHHLGLPHTSEFDGFTHDRLPDTPEGDRRNLMHAEPDPEAGQLSPWQARILLGSMWVRHPD